MEDKKSFLKEKIDIKSPNKNIVPLTTSVGSDGKLSIGGCSIEELVKQYDSYGANTDKVSLVYVVGGGGGEYNNQNRILDLYDTDSAGGTSIPLQTTATVNIPSLYRDITMFLVGKPLSSGGVNCTGFCRFKIERV